MRVHRNSSLREGYPGGDPGEVEISLYTGERSGTIVKHVTVYTNDSENPSKQLTIKATLTGHRGPSGKE